MHMGLYVFQKIMVLRDLLLKFQENIHFIFKFHEIATFLFRSPEKCDFRTPEIRPHDHSPEKQPD
jgi:hypothetical protein